MDANGAVQLLLGQPALECGCKALRHLSSIWTQYVEAHDTFVVFKVTDDFCITFVVIPGWNCPFQWPEETVVNFNIFFPKFLYSFFFREATAAILQRSKHSRWDIVIVTFDSGAAIQPLSQQSPRLDGHGVSSSFPSRMSPMA